MEIGQEIGAVRLNAHVRGVSPPVVRTLLVAEQSSLAEIHQVLQVAFGWSGEHPYTFLIRDVTVFEHDARAITCLPNGCVDHRPGQVVGPYDEIGEQQPEHRVDRSQQVAVSTAYAYVSSNSTYPRFQKKMYALPVAS